MKTGGEVVKGELKEAFIVKDTQTLSEKLFRIKHIQHKEPNNGFHRVFGISQLVMFGIGNSIGAGIFALSGIAAQVAGSSLVLSFLISGLISMTTALVYCEFSSRMPHSGSGYSFVYATFGELPAWIVGWNFCVRFGITGGALFRAWSSYLVDLMSQLGVTVPTYLYALKVGSYDGSLITVLAIIIATFIITRGSKGSGDFNYTLTSIKLITLMFITIVAFTKFNPENFTPFFIEDKGFQGTLEGALILFFAYLGFDCISTLAEESRNPLRDLPSSTLQTVVYCTAIYCLIVLSVTGMQPLQGFIPETAMARAFYASGMNWMGYVIYVSAFFGISSAAFANLLPMSRILYAYANDGLFFSVFKDIDPQRKVPVKGAWIVCGFIALICFFLNLEELTKMVSLVSLFNYSLINAGAIALRFRQHQDDIDLIEKSPHEIWAFVFAIFAFLSAFSFGYQWHYLIQILFGIIVIGVLIFLHTIKQEIVPSHVFKCPLVPLIPCIGIYFNFVLASQVQSTIWIYFFIYEALGLIFYFSYGLKHSQLNQSNREDNVDQIQKLN